MFYVKLCPIICVTPFSEIFSKCFADFSPSLLTNNWYSGTMKLMVYIYIICIVLLLMYTAFVYFITEKYQPRMQDTDGSKLLIYSY